MNLQPPPPNPSVSTWSDHSRRPIVQHQMAPGNDYNINNNSNNLPHVQPFQHMIPSFAQNPLLSIPFPYNFCQPPMFAPPLFSGPQMYSNFSAATFPSMSHVLPQPSVPPQPHVPPQPSVPTQPSGHFQPHLPPQPQVPLQPQAAPSVPARRNPARPMVPEIIPDNTSDHDDSADGIREHEDDVLAEDDASFEEDYLNQGKGRLQNYKETFGHLADIFQDRFSPSESSQPFYRLPNCPAAREIWEASPDFPNLSVDPVLEGTWFSPPNLRSPSDTVKYWDHNTSFPKKSAYMPTGSLYKAPPRIPFFSFQNEDLGAMLKAPLLKKIHLDQDAFNRSAYDVSLSPHSTLDWLLRQGLLDTLLSQEFLSLSVELASLATLPDASPDDRSYYTDILLRTLYFASESAHRSSQFQTAAFTSNKLALRDLVLSCFYGSGSTAAVLRGTSFLTPGLFGTIPESLRHSITSSHGADNRLSLKSGKGLGLPNPTPKPAKNPSLPSTKRTSSSGSSQPKRSRGSSHHRGLTRPFRMRRRAKKN